MEQSVARRAHNPKVTGSSPVPATKHGSADIAQSVEHLTFNQGVRSSNLRWVTTLIWRHDQVAKVEDCNSFIPSSNLGVASKYSKVAQWWSTRLLTDRLRVRVPPLEPRKCRSGGTGRRTGLKILRNLYFRTGSIPVFGTKLISRSGAVGSSSGS